MAKRMVFTPSKGYEYILDIVDGMVNVGTEEGIEWFRNHTGVKASMQIGEYLNVDGKLKFKEDISLGA